MIPCADDKKIVNSAPCSQPSQQNQEELLAGNAATTTECVVATDACSNKNIELSINCNVTDEACKRVDASCSVPDAAETVNQIEDGTAKETVGDGTARNAESAAANAKGQSPAAQPNVGVQRSSQLFQELRQTLGKLQDATPDGEQSVIIELLVPQSAAETAASGSTVPLQEAVVGVSSLAEGFVPAERQHTMRNVIMPEFWRDKRELWFAMLENSFQTHNIESEEEKFFALLPYLKEDMIDHDVFMALRLYSRNQLYEGVKRALLTKYY